MLYTAEDDMIRQAILADIEAHKEKPVKPHTPAEYNDMVRAFAAQRKADEERRQAWKVGTWTMPEREKDWRDRWLHGEPKPWAVPLVRLVRKIARVRG